VVGNDVEEPEETDLLKQNRKRSRAGTPLKTKLSKTKPTGNKNNLGHTNREVVMATARIRQGLSLNTEKRGW